MFIKELAFHRLLIDRDDSINGSKTQSSATTESNTPENTVRLENMGQKVVHNFHIENNEVILESEFESCRYFDDCNLNILLFLQRVFEKVKSLNKLLG